MYRDSAIWSLGVVGSELAIGGTAGRHCGTKNFELVLRSQINPNNPERFKSPPNNSQLQLLRLVAYSRSFTSFLVLSYSCSLSCFHLVISITAYSKISSHPRSYKRTVFFLTAINHTDLTSTYKSPTRRTDDVCAGSHFVHRFISTIRCGVHQGRFDTQNSGFCLQRLL